MPPTPKGAVEAYEPERDTWTPQAFMPTPRMAFGVCSLGDMIYTIGGAEHAGWTGRVEVDEPKSGHWAQGEAMPTARGWLGAAVAFGRIYVAGGIHVGREHVYRATVEECGPATGEPSQTVLKYGGNRSLYHAWEDVRSRRRSYPR